MTDHIPDVSKMVPWADEPTPLTDANAIEEYSPRLKLYADIEVSRNVERRMRAAERLLEKAHDALAYYGDEQGIIAINAHLEAAKKGGRAMSDTQKVVGAREIMIELEDVKYERDEWLEIMMELKDVKHACDEWREIADQMRADRYAYRKERDAFEKQMRAAERLLAEVVAGYEAERAADFDWIEWYQKAKPHLEAARKEDA